MPCRVDLIYCTLCGGSHYMPNECVSNPSKIGEGLSAAEKKRMALVAEAEKIIEEKAKFDTQGALCDVLTVIEHLGHLDRIPQDILDWWSSHQSAEQEKIKEEALAKLSAKEKRALGIL